MRTGAGVVRLAVPRSLGVAVMPYLLESTLYPLSEENGAIKLDKNEIDGALKGIKALGIGMGLGQRGENQRVLEYILSSTALPVLLDADALNTISSLGEEIIKNSKCKIVLTPHLKELERLSKVMIEEIEQNPVDTLKSYANKTGAIVLLKGTTTIVTDGKRVVFIDTGCAGMATAGSGDVLSGIITSLLGQHPDKVFEMVCLGAYINGIAGMLASDEETEISMVASDTAKNISRAIKEILKGK
jgi:NAD(P)H-hydrate epimerase